MSPAVSTTARASATSPAAGGRCAARAPAYPAYPAHTHPYCSCLITTTRMPLCLCTPPALPCHGCALHKHTHGARSLLPSPLHASLLRGARHAPSMDPLVCRARLRVLVVGALHCPCRRPPFAFRPIAAAPRSAVAQTPVRPLMTAGGLAARRLLTWPSRPEARPRPAVTQCAMSPQPRVAATCHHAACPLHATLPAICVNAATYRRSPCGSEATPAAARAQTNRRPPPVIRPMQIIVAPSRGRSAMTNRPPAHPFAPWPACGNGPRPGPRKPVTGLSVGDRAAA